MCGICGELTFNGDPAGSSLAAMMRADAAARAGRRRRFLCRIAWRSAIAGSASSILPRHRAADDRSGARACRSSSTAASIISANCAANFRRKGYRFFSQGDTEVILKAYEEWGPRCVERFYGMFAFAIWERDSGRVVLARDRLGIKPLYYAERPGRFRFASTLPALLAAGDVDTAIDPAALHHYLSWHAVVPAPMTIIKGVRKLAAGDDLHHRARRPPPRGNLLAA